MFMLRNLDFTETDKPIGFIIMEDQVFIETFAAQLFFLIRLFVFKKGGEMLFDLCLRI